MPEQSLSNTPTRQIMAFLFLGTLDSMSALRLGAILKQGNAQHKTQKCKKHNKRQKNNAN